MSHHVVFNNEYNVLICKEHQSAIPSTYVARHFQEEHDLNLVTRQAIQNYAFGYTFTEPMDLVYSNEKISPIPYLKIVDGFQCLYEPCTKIYGTIRAVKEHCRAGHSWKAKDGKRWMETRAQTFYQGNNQRCVSVHL